MNKKLIGLTGGIGSGKSYVSSKLQAKGIPVYDCDAEAKRLMIERMDVVETLVSRFGRDVYEWADERPVSVNRAVFAARLFSDSEALEWVNSVVHPVVTADLLNWHAQQNVPLVFVESAILLESHLDDVVDAIVIVDAPRELRIARVMRRNHCTEEQVTERMARQQSDETLREHADFVILNDGSADLDEQIAACLAALS
jgi:dephospho-CoA kinase